MDEQQIRLECLKLAHRHDRAPIDIVAVCVEYEKFVKGVENPTIKKTLYVENSTPTAKKKRGRPPRQP